jgi:Predicted glycosyltransferases
MNNELENLTVVVLTHKTNKNTLENCLSLIDPNVKIILVENSNNFLHKEHIENKYKNVSIFCSGSNLGYGGSNNIGLKLTKHHML